MRFRPPVFLSAALLVGAAAGRCQQAQPGHATIVQPGAPGAGSRTLAPGYATPPLRAPSAADIRFMQDMIMHHGQAVEMTALLRTRSQSKELQELGRRISISQSDEMKFMKQWLEDRGQPLAAPMHAMGDMNGMDMDDMAPMPGMLTPRQMKALAQASGPAFDRLFLTGMIQHHSGALTMVDELFQTPAAGEDPQLFDFATDVDNTQLAEIRIMQALLKETK